MREIYDYVNMELKEEEKTQIGFGTIVLEHALCKLTRLKDAYGEINRKVSGAKKRKKK